MSITACGETENTTAATTTSTETTSETTAATTETGLPELNENGDYTIELPLSDDLVTFSMWGGTPYTGSGLNDQNESVARQELEARTNVHIEWTHPVSGQEQAQFNLMVASNIYTDAIFGATGYMVGGVDKYINDEVIIDLAPYSEYFPNYMLRRAEANELDPDCLRMTVTDQGRLGFIQSIKKTLQGSYGGFMVRKDATDELGIDTDKVDTYDDWYDMLTQLKAYGFEIPFVEQKSTNGYLGANSLFLAGRDSGVKLFQIDGQVMYGPYTEGYKENLKMLAQWYAEGLYDQDFYSRTNPDSETMCLNGKAACSYIQRNNYDRYNASTVDGGQWIAIEVPRQSPDQIRKVGGMMVWKYATNSAYTISTQCDESKIPYMLKYFDYGFTYDGYILYNYGIEGKSFNFIDGKPTLTDEMLNNPDGLSIEQMITINCIHHNCSSCLYDWERTLGENTSEYEKFGASEVWDEHITPESFQYMPSLSIKEDVQTEYAAKLNDINTMAEEYSVKFISGEMDIDTQYDSFIAEMERMGIQQVLEWAQEAYESYLNRDITVGYTEAELVQYGIME